MSVACSQCGNLNDADSNCSVCLLQLGISNSPEQSGVGIPLGSLPTVAELDAQFGHLDITGLIGRGGMGAIYHARQTSLDRDVALKLIAKEVSADPAFLERFEREAKTLAKLSHANIVTIYDFGHTPDGLGYLVMEYVDGINLRDAIKSKEISPQESVEITRTICTALDYAHSKGVVHRDIKPENILLGEDGAIKVADFGIAKILDDSVRNPTLTATRQVLGSLHYLAPEHIEAPESVDHRVDLYAVGVVLYELLTGQLPLGRFEAPSAFVRNLDQSVDELVLKCLSRQPAKRFQSASEIVAAIDNLGGSLSRASLEPNISEEFESLPVAEPYQPVREVSVPFTADCMGGFAETLGVIHAAPGTMRIEFRTRDAILGVAKSGLHTIHIPASKIVNLDLTRKVFKSRLRIMTSSASVLGSLPNAETGTVTFKIARDNIPLAKQMLEIMRGGVQVNLRTSVNAAGPNVFADNDDSVSRRITFALLIILCALVNLGGLASIIIAMSDSGANEPAATIVIIASAILIGPIAVLQLVTGILSMIFNATSLAKAVSIISLLPITPAWPLSCPLAIWELRLMEQRRATKSAAGNSTPSKSWGATTMMFLRETKASKNIAIANVVALILVVAGIVVYQTGYYPITQRYRVVAGADRFDEQEVLRTVEARLGNHLSSVPILGFYGAADYRRLEFEILQQQADTISELLSIDDPVQLVWLRGEALVGQPSGSSVESPAVESRAVREQTDRNSVDAARVPNDMETESLEQSVVRELGDDSIVNNTAATEKVASPFPMAEPTASRGIAEILEFISLKKLSLGEVRTLLVWLLDQMREMLQESRLDSSEAIESVPTSFSANPLAVIKSGENGFPIAADLAEKKLGSFKTGAIDRVNSTGTIQVLNAEMVKRVEASDNSLTLSLTQEGNSFLSLRPVDSNGYLGLIVQGGVVAVASPGNISLRDLVFEVSTTAEFSSLALESAIRGPELPCALELLP